MPHPPPSVGKDGAWRTTRAPHHLRAAPCRRRHPPRGRRLARGARRVGHATGRAAGYAFRQTRRATHAEGAGESGLSRLIELHAFNAAGDAAVAISLAGTLFFQVPAGEARLQVAQFLGLTMLPFAIVAPLVGPFLDRFSHGRRWAIGAMMALRAFLCWVLADAVVTGSVALFPAALGCLVASKAYGVTRRRRAAAAAAPADPGQGQLPDLAGQGRGRGRLGAAGRARVDLRAGVVPALRVRGVRRGHRAGDPAAVAGRLRRRRGSAALGSVAGGPGAGARLCRHRSCSALRCNMGLRLLSGFLTMFMAFLLREEPFPGWEDRPELLLGLVIGAAGFGSTVGIALGSLLRTVKPEVTVVVTLLADAVMAVVVAAFYGCRPPCCSASRRGCRSRWASSPSTR